MKLGFAKEGNIPGFYKRSDAYLLGCTVSGQPRNIPIESETRIAISPPGSFVPDPIEEEVVVDTTAHDFAEKTLVLAKKRAKELLGDSQPLLEPFRYARYADGRLHPVSNSPFPWS